MSSKISKIKKKQAEKRKKERFISLRMWFSTFISLLYPDRVTIPTNIGNRVFVGNNQQVTKRSISRFILVTKFSTEMPVGWQGYLINKVKKESPGTSVDFITKVIPKNINPKDSGLEARVRTWYNTIENPDSSKRSKEDAARLIYTYEKLTEGVKYYDTLVAIRVRAKDGLSSKIAVNTAIDYIAKNGSECKLIKSRVQLLLETILLTSRNHDARKKDLPSVLQSCRTLAEAMPLTQGTIVEDGVMLGVNLRNNSPYVFNFKHGGAAKNIGVFSGSGDGKTHLIRNWILDFVSLPDCVCSITDIKGELAAPVKALGGIVIPCRADSGQFLNTFVFRKEDVRLSNGTNYEMYYSERYKISLKIICIAIDNHTRESDIEDVVDLFLQNLYLKRGVYADNPNTWINSEGLHPLDLAKEFNDFASGSIKEKYNDLIDKIQVRLNMYFDRSGSKSYLFTEEYQISDVLENRIISFDFGLLESTGIEDLVSFNIKSLFYSIINNMYCAKSKKEHKYTLLIQEEAQLAERASGEGDVQLLKEYANNFSLRRSQNVVNVLLTNSYSALARNKDANPILSNINIVVVGGVNNEDREGLVKQYSLENEYDDLTRIYSGAVGMMYQFLVVNRSDKRIPPTFIKVLNPVESLQGTLMKGADTEDED